MSGSVETFETVPMSAKKPTPINRDADELLVRGIDALERNHIDEAIAMLRQAVQLEPSSFYGQLGLGIALTKKLEIPEAQWALEAAIELEPENFYAHLRMAQMYQRVGVAKKAKEELQTALDCARTAEEKKIARDSLQAEWSRDRKRIWRPDFASLIGRRNK